ncbi:MAG: GAF domain-containing protein [Pseudomonadota bacterium]
MRDYDFVSKTIAALCEGETDVITKMATISCELFHSMDGFDWVGFYRLTEPKLLKIGPYQGGHGCLVIHFDNGVCGACARTEEIQIVDDVEAFPGHIACSATTQSEIVLPVFQSGKLIGVLDVDSNSPASFDSQDAQALAKILDENF